MYYACEFYSFVQYGLSLDNQRVGSITGMDFYITKPCERNALYQYIKLKKLSGVQESEALRKRCIKWMMMREHFALRAITSRRE